ncbi:hypothetical protein NPIL_304081 [Nephila pilipes]|uniref:Uncharacterized protein n=1 Tax=Nephila pilipes TaxID=299642 RepID=A0A8X6TPU0_NEPPI|nr:hypothetical protein NPIL_304081 [Nephila pilipes]
MILILLNVISWADTQFYTLVAMLSAASILYHSVKITMKAYFAVLVSVCVVLLAVQSVEMSPDARVRRDSDNIITLEIPQDILVRLLEAVLSSLGLDDILGK